MYFNKASVLDFNTKECLLFYLNVNGNFGLVVNEDWDCMLNEIVICNENIYVNRKVIERINNDELNIEGKELKEIISDIYFKIEDVILEIKEYDKFIEEKNKMKERNNDGFGNIGMFYSELWYYKGIRYICKCTSEEEKEKEMC